MVNVFYYVKRQSFLTKGISNALERAQSELYADLSETPQLN